MLIGNQEEVSMHPTRPSVEARRQQLAERLASLKPFRRGTVSVNYRKCGKASCHCARPGERGHGPQYLWNATIGGKSYAKNLSTPEEVARYQEETERYREFVRVCEELVAVNETLCSLERGSEQAAETAEAVKKKLQQHATKPSRKN
jgi:hypothetical protein